MILSSLKDLAEVTGIPLCTLAGKLSRCNAKGGNIYYKRISGTRMWDSDAVLEFVRNEHSTPQTHNNPANATCSWHEITGDLAMSRKTRAAWSASRELNEYLIGWNKWTNQTIEDWNNARLNLSA